METVYLSKNPPGHKIIDAFIFLKDIFDANGNFIDIKGSIVAKGNDQNIETVGDSNSISNC
jgi:hypothetical protein